ncbi:MAG: sugar phosphate nucleotidyltransferase [Prevotella sp.]|nr:sugar phosphate nucleotidyltransferase [Prevotella sp.]
MQHIILAAGKGSRLNIKVSNKCLIEANGKTLISYNLELSKYISASEILIIVGYNKSYIMNYVGTMYNGIPIKYIVQEPQLGIAHGIMTAAPYITDSFFMCLSDEILVSPKIYEQNNFFVQSNADCICGAVKDDIECIKKAYTMELKSNNRISQIIEKPTFAYNQFKGTGYCMMKHTMLDCLFWLNKNKSRNEYEMGDWINLAIRQNFRCFAFNIGQASFNINELSDLQKAEKYLQNRSV